MALNNPYQKYRQNSVLSAPPEELTHMLFNGGVRFIRQGIQDIDSGQTEKAHQSITRAQDIYVHLQNNLNHDIELSARLGSLYDFMIRHLTRANIKKDAAMLNEALTLAEELRNTWHEAVQSVRKQVNEG